MSGAGSQSKAVEASFGLANLSLVVLGDPSFDSFEHRAGNPIVRGKPPFNWPVNGFLFEDPKSGNWYAYIGHYLTGYDIGPNLPTMHCRVHRSKDRSSAAANCCWTVGNWPIWIFTPIASSLPESFTGLTTPATATTPSSFARPRAGWSSIRSTC
jgi:hypothetical protein